MMTNTNSDIEQIELILGHNHHNRIGGEPCPMANELQGFLTQSQNALLNDLEAKATAMAVIPDNMKVVKNKKPIEMEVVEAIPLSALQSLREDIK